MENVSTRIANLAPSATIAMNQKSNDLKAQGVDVINLSVGEPDFFTPDHIKEAAKKAIDNNFSFYPPVPGYPDLRKAVVEKFKRENGIDYAVDQIIISTGAKHSLANVIMSLINPGDEVIIPTPYWVTYEALVTIAEGKNVFIRGAFENDFKVTAAEIEAAITPKTKAIMLCSPSNPSGAVYTKDELKAIADVVAKHDNLYVITDEIYEHINYVGKHETIAQFDYIKDRVVLINGVSKAYAMTGYRIGYMAAPLWLAKACNKLQGQVTSGCTTIAQKAAIEALTGDQTCVKEMLDAFTRRRNLIMGLINDMPNVEVMEPQGAFYVFPKMSAYYGKSVNGKAIANSTDLCIYLLEEAHIATVPGEAFGEPDCIRISFATSDEKISDAMGRMKAALAKLA